MRWSRYAYSQPAANICMIQACYQALQISAFMGRVSEILSIETTYIQFAGHDCTNECCKLILSNLERLLGHFINTSPSASHTSTKSNNETSTDVKDQSLPIQHKVKSTSMHGFYCIWIDGCQAASHYMPDCGSHCLTAFVDKDGNLQACWQYLPTQIPTHCPRQTQSSTKVSCQDLAQVIARSERSCCS